jgi:hypothetical protein
MTRTEIIAQIDAELTRLQSARDFLAAALADSRNGLTRKATTKAPAKSRKPLVVAITAEANSLQAEVIVEAPTLQLAPEPQVHRVPPRRRMGRRQPQAEKPGKATAALSGLVPAGPVAVSADEARKMQERSALPVPLPIESEIRAEIGSERSLGSLIQAFERRTGLSRIETP